MRPVLSLPVDFRTPVHVGEHYDAGRGEVNADASRFDVAYKNFYQRIVLEAVDRLLPVVHVVLAGQLYPAYLQLAHFVREHFDCLGVLRKDDDLFVLLHRVLDVGRDALDLGPAADLF